MTDRAERWLAFAREDLRMAQIALREGIYTQVCFHSQQCVEKALKGLLIHLGKEPPRTHAITDLISGLPERPLKGLEVELGNLDVYYLLTRYPDALPGTLPEGLPGLAEAEEALAWAERGLAAIETALDK